MGGERKAEGEKVDDSEISVLVPEKMRWEQAS